MSSLVIMIMSGPDDGQRLYLTQEHGDGYVTADGSWAIVFGRREECDISIPFDTQVSRQHAILRITPNSEFWLVDASSLNGTYIKERRISKPTQVQPGELFRLGRTSVRIESEAGG